MQSAHHRQRRIVWLDLRGGIGGVSLTGRHLDRAKRSHTYRVPWWARTSVKQPQPGIPSEEGGGRARPCPAHTARTWSMAEGSPKNAPISGPGGRSSTFCCQLRAIKFSSPHRFRPLQSEAAASWQGYASDMRRRKRQWCCMHVPCVEMRDAPPYLTKSSAYALVLTQPSPCCPSLARSPPIHASSSVGSVALLGRSML